MTPTAMTATASEFRAAGTDLSERRRSGVSRGPLIDISATSETIGMHWAADGSLRLGAFTTIAAIARPSHCSAVFVVASQLAAAPGASRDPLRESAPFG